MGPTLVGSNSTPSYFVGMEAAAGMETEARQNGKASQESEGDHKKALSSHANLIRIMKDWTRKVVLARATSSKQQQLNDIVSRF